MGNLINSVFNNDSLWGRVTTRLGILMAANILFCIFCLPVVTIVPAITALYHVTFRILRTEDGVINPFKEFWTGFRNNFKQAFICGLVLIGFMLIAYADLQFVNSREGILLYFKYGIYVIAACVLAVSVMLFPVMACFSDTLSGLIRNAVYFIGKNPLRLIFLVVLDIGPLVYSYMDVQRLPLWGFCWTVIGFAAAAMIGSYLLIRDFRRFLPKLEWEEERKQGR